MPSRRACVLSSLCSRPRDSRSRILVRSAAAGRRDAALDGTRREAASSGNLARIQRGEGLGVAHVVRVTTPHQELRKTPVVFIVLS